MTFYPTAVMREVHGEPEKAARLTRMLEIEDEVFQTAAGILGAALDFCHVTPDQQEPPPDWVSRFGAEGAKQRLAVAKAGWMPQSLAPASLKIAAQMYTGIARIRGMQARGATGPREVNAKIALPAPKGAGMPGAPEYPSKEVE